MEGFLCFCWQKPNFSGLQSINPLTLLGVKLMRGHLHLKVNILKEVLLSSFLCGQDINICLKITAIFMFYEKDWAFCSVNENEAKIGLRLILKEMNQKRIRAARKQAKNSKKI